ncbi:MAG TPA: hypothetical protein GX505_05330 [Clostridiales bacterium]|nr:hypothetical protein [Clostridiales bacterium]
MGIKKIKTILSLAMIALVIPGCTLLQNQNDKVVINPDSNDSQNIETEKPEPVNSNDIESVIPDNIQYIRDKVWKSYIETILNDESRRKEFESNEMVFGDVSMRYAVFKIGEEPEGGYPLYIALHGGGEVPEEVHEQQWNSMKFYYRWSVKRGIYVAVRGVRRLYNTHSQDESYPLYDRLIENMIAFENINPNRVYLLGFSAGGDGVYQIAPRMADRFAAVNMSAGHPNGVSLKNVKNLPFAIQMGEKDAAYDRNKQAAIYDNILEELKNSEGGYIHQTFIHVNKPHNFLDNDVKREPQSVITDIKAWLEGKESPSQKVNTNAVDWVSQFERNPYPESIYWDLTTQADLRSTGSFYWLSLNAPGQQEGEIKARLDAESNSVIIDVADVKDGFTVLLNEQMLDIFKPVNIEVEGRHFTVNVKPSEEFIRKTTFERGDYNYQFAACIVLRKSNGEWSIAD